MTGQGWAPVARRVVDTRTAAEHDGMLLDLFTALHVVKVLDALSPANRAWLERMPLPAAVELVWKLLKRVTR